MKKENLGRKEYINDDLYEFSSTDLYFSKCIQLISKVKKIQGRDMLFYRHLLQSILKVFRSTYVLRNYI